MPKELPLYTVISKGMYAAIKTNRVYRKGTTRLVLDVSNHTVGLKEGDLYYAQQFGTLEQAENKYNKIKRGL